MSFRIERGEVFAFLGPNGAGKTTASHIQRMEGFSVVMQLLLFPMLLSGALFPLGGLPGWLAVLTRINPLTYAGAALRGVVFAAQHMPPAAPARFPSSVTLLGHTLSNDECVGITCAFAAAAS